MHSPTYSSRAARPRRRRCARGLDASPLHLRPRRAPDRAASAVRCRQHALTRLGKRRPCIVGTDTSAHVFDACLKKHMRMFATTVIRTRVVTIPETCRLVLTPTRRRRRQSPPAPGRPSAQNSSLAPRARLVRGSILPRWPGAIPTLRLAGVAVFAGLAPPGCVSKLCPLSVHANCARS